MTRAVVLEHTLPDGSRHFDWMIERPEPGTDRRLCTWRTEHRPDVAGRFRGERIGDHRSAYLEFEGELSENRGRVVRLASGGAVWRLLEADRMSVEVDWNGGPKVRYEGENGAGGVWLFRGSPD